MTPDERSRVPMPEHCRGCSHRRVFVNAAADRMVTRYECRHPQQPPIHPECGFRAPATAPSGGYTPDAL